MRLFSDQRSFSQASGSRFNLACVSDSTSTARALLFHEQPWDSAPRPRSLLAGHPLRRFVPAAGALVENRVFPAIERGPESHNMHRSKAVAGRATNQRGRAMASICRQHWRGRIRHVSFSSRGRKRNTPCHQRSPNVPLVMCHHVLDLLESMFNIARSRKSN